MLITSSEYREGTLDLRKCIGWLIPGKDLSFQFHSLIAIATPRPPRPPRPSHPPLPPHHSSSHASMLQKHEK